MKITELTSRPEIVVLDTEFGDREEYMNAIKQFIRQNDSKHHCIVFLDPDIGLEPHGRPKHDHVLKKELKEIWKEMPPKWVLVIYQHKTTLSGQEWVEPKCKQFSEAINIPRTDIKIAHGFDIANNVVFFYAVKPMSD
jgi:signal recognition particle GTPase